MTAMDTMGAFADFREAAFDDRRLMTQLRVSQPRHAQMLDLYVARVVALGAERGFVFDEGTVRAAMREGEERWLMLGADVV